MEKGRKRKKEGKERGKEGITEYVMEQGNDIMRERKKINSFNVKEEGKK